MMKIIIVDRCLKCGYVGNTDGVYCLVCIIERLDTEEQKRAKARARSAALRSIGYRKEPKRMTFKTMTFIIDRLALMPWMPFYRPLLHWARRQATRQQYRDWVAAKRTA